MHIALTTEQQQLQQEVRTYFRQLMTPERREATRGNEGGDAYKDTIRQLGRDGWLAVGWPKAYGGRGLGAVEQLIFFEEAQLAEVPLPFVTINTVAPALMAMGSEAHKAFFLPKIANGELHFAIGYSEPDAGTDLASLKTTAVPDGDDYVINGTKVYTSSAEAADYIWLAARTDPSAAKPHKGISIFMVPTDQPGFSYSPIHTVGNVRTNVTYYDKVRCPAAMIAGELNGGWPLITSQLNHERIGLAAIGIRGLGLYHRVLEWATTTTNLSTIQTQALAEARHRLDAMRLMNWRMAWQTDQGQVDPAFASAMKAFSTETLIVVYRLLLDVTGPAGLYRRSTAAQILLGDLEEEYRKCQINTFGGGVAEVMRDLVARFGLQMQAYQRQ